MRDYAGALTDLNKAYDLNRSDVNTLKARATIKHLLNDFQGSLDDLNKAFELEPCNPFILKERVALKVMMNNYTGALEDLRNAHDLDPDMFTTGLQKGFKKRAHEYLKAMADLLHKALHGMTVLGEGDILHVYNNLSSRIVFLLELTKMVFQIYTYFTLVVVFIFNYLMGYVERGQWGTYSNGSWEFRSTYVCIELRLGAYPFQKFREVASNHLNGRGHPQHDQNVVHHQPNLTLQVHGDTPSKRGRRDAVETKFCGIYCRRRRGKQGVRMLFEPRVSSQRHKLSRIYLGEHESLKQAVLIRDVAHFVLGKEGPFNVNPRVYMHDVARTIPNGMSPQQIRKFVEKSAEKVKQSAFEEAYKEAFEIVELMAEFGHQPNSYYLHSNRQGSPEFVSHSLCESEDSLRAHAMSSSYGDPPVVAPHEENLQDCMSAKDGTTNFNVDLSTSASTHDPINVSTLEFGPLGHHLGSNFANCHQVIDINEDTPCVDFDQDVEPCGSVSSNLPYYGPIPSSSHLWVRRIIIYPPLGTTFFQCDHKLQEFVFAPTMFCMFSTLEVFGAQGWTVAVNSCSTSTECPLVDIAPSNHLDKVQEERKCILRIQKIGTAADLTLSPALHGALDKFRCLPGWVALY